MSHVLCLIADPNRAPLAPQLVIELARLCHGSPRWLAEAEACELPLTGIEPARLSASAAPLLAGMAVDWAILPAGERRKRLLVSDMDSTMITVECIDELADLVGVKTEVAAITRRAMNGELDFEAALTARVALLEGLPVARLAEVYEARVRLMPGARTLLRTMRAGGAFTALVSGGFMPFALRVQQALGFDLVAANQLEVQGDRLTGRVLPPIAGAGLKLSVLQRLQAEHGLTREQTMAVGDGANDLPMLENAGLGVAFRAHPAVAAATKVAINVGDLSALLYLQGIPKQAFLVD